MSESSRIDENNAKEVNALNSNSQSNFDEFVSIQRIEYASQALPWVRIQKFLTNGYGDSWDKDFTVPENIIKLNNTYYCIY